MKKTLTAAAIAAVLVGALWMGTYAAAASASAAPVPSLKESKVSISNFTFSPAALEVPAGTTLRWVNDDDVPHTVLGSDKGSVIRSPALDTNDGYAVVLTEPGTYHYFCSLHPHMTGTIVVK
jgi:plastocyanin